MQRLAITVGALVVILLAAPAGAQQYWDYDEWENQWELHKPTEGLKYEYENGVDVEEEQYEWEPGEGYHQQEWYDPSDWFSPDRDLDYERDDWTLDWSDYYFSPYFGFGGYYDDTYYEDDDSDRGNPRDDARGDRTARGERRQLRGRIVGLQSIRAQNGRPRSVRLELETEDGQTRILHLGDTAYARYGLPRLRRGERVVIGGRQVEADGRTMFKAQEIRSQEGRYTIPEYQYNRRLEGRLAGLKRVRLRDADVEALVAKIETSDGKSREVLLGRLDDLRDRGQSLRPGARVRVEGFERGVSGRESFVVQNLQIAGEDRDRSRAMQRGQEIARRRGQQAEQRTSGREDQDQQSPGQRLRTVQLTGEVQSTTGASVRGEERLMARIRTEQGDRVLIDLGPRNQLDVELDEGDQLTARGIPLNVDGQRILVATRLEHGDRQFDLRRRR